MSADNYSDNYYDKVSCYSSRGGYDKMQNLVINYYDACLKLGKIQAGNGKSILEVGCAYGYGCKLLYDRGFKVYGCDISSHAILEANKIMIRSELESSSFIDHE